MGLFNNLSVESKLSLALGIPSISKSLHLMSIEELKDLSKKLQEILDRNEEILNPKEEDMDFHTELDELEFADDIRTFAELANILDKRGFYKVADDIDKFIKLLVIKKKKPYRQVATAIRNQKRNIIAQVDISSLSKKLNLDSDVLKKLNPQQLSYINNIKNPSVARKWVNKLQPIPLQPKPERLPIQLEQPEKMPSGKEAPQELETFGNLKVEAAEYQGKKVKLNDPIRNPSGSKKKFRVYVKDPKTGKVKKVQFGDPKLEIKRDDPKRRKSFRARHKCDTEAAKDKTKAKYWSCYQWRKGKKVDN